MEGWWKEEEETSQVVQSLTAGDREEEGRGTFFEHHYSPTDASTTATSPPASSVPATLLAGLAPATAAAGQLRRAMSTGAVASASRQPTSARYREVQLPDELASAVFPSSPAFMTDDERRAADQAERELYLDRLDRRLKGIARRREKERRLASRLHPGGSGGTMMAGKARSADQWAHVGLDRHWEEAEAEERLRDREREAGILAAFREEHAKAVRLASSTSSSASSLTAGADADDDAVPILRYWRYEEGTIGGGGEANGDGETGGHCARHPTAEIRDEGDDEADEGDDGAQQRGEGSLLWDSHDGDGDDDGSGRGREPGLLERRRKGTKKQQQRRREEDGPWSTWLSVGTDGFARRFIFWRPLQPVAVFDTSSIFLFRAPHLSLSLYGLLSPGPEHLPLNQSSIDAQFKHHKENIAAKTPGESWRAFLTYLASYRRLDLAFALLDDLERHDQATPSVYLAFLNACARVVHREADARAQETIARMQARGLEPGVSHYTALLAAATSPARIKAAFQAMTDAGIEPTPVTYVAYFKACSRFSSWNGHGPTLQGYHQFKQRFGASVLNKSTAVHLFGALIASLAQFASPATEQEVMKVLRDMEKAGLKLNSYFANSLIFMYLRSDQPGKAYELLNRAKAGTDVEPNGIMYTTFLRHHHDRREYDHCKKLLARMRDDRVAPTHAAMGTLKLISEELQDPTIWAAANELLRGAAKTAAG